MPLNDLGIRLRTLREIKGMSQAALGSKCNVSQKAISHYERNYRTPPPEVIPLLAEALGTTTGELYGEPVKPPPDTRLKKITLWQIAEKLDQLDESQQREVLRYVERLIAVKRVGDRD